MRYKLLGILILLLLAGTAIWRAMPVRESALRVEGCERCNIVVVLIDTLRADHLEAYGYRRKTAPFLSSLIQKSLKFERAFSASSWTAPATASIFTSMLPSFHGVYTGFAATKTMIRKKKKIELNRIPLRIKTLGQYMQEAGFTTIGVADNLNIGHEMGFDRGFQYFKKYIDQGSELINETAREFLSRAPKDKPFFLYLHYMDPHAPYKKRRPFYDECLKENVTTHEERVICSYDSEINFLDQKIEALFNEYKFLENSVVILLADHGEEFLDHGNTGHGKTLYTEMLHVPFTLYIPGKAPKSVKANVHTFDLLPTLSGLLGGKSDSAWQGYDLFKYITEQDGKNRALFAERLRNSASDKDWWLRSVIRGDWHYIRTDNPAGLLKQELFNLELDFVEKNNLALQEKELTSELDQVLGGLRLNDQDNDHDNDQSEVELDKDLVDQLKSLGYVN